MTIETQFFVFGFELSNITVRCFLECECNDLVSILKKLLKTRRDESFIHGDGSPAKKLKIY